MSRLPGSREPADGALRIDFVRPRLGIGGSERFVVDAARELQRLGHRVVVRAPGVGGAPEFDEVTAGQVPRDASGSWLPVAVGGRLRTPCAILRALRAGLRSARSRPDLVVCDVVAHVVPLVRRLAGAPVLFYCHYPDALLTAAGARDHPAYRLYRRPLDDAEAHGLSAADLVLVNSHFTAAALARAFPGLESGVQVVYPGVDVDTWASPRPPPAPDRLRLLSLARFDPRKGQGLAVEALAALRTRLPPRRFERVHLTLAGHLEARWPEARALIDALEARARDLGLRERVSFVTSPSQGEVRALIAGAFAVVSTAAAEHFGYVPLEAMAAGVPVVVADQGGPAETVLDGVTGRACPASAEAFASALAEMVMDPDRAARMGEAGRAHVRRRFSLARFASEFETACRAVAGRRQDRRVSTLSGSVRCG
ncbi:MAG TPA: glycosyltransferase [Vicinamibacteria bacterium]